MNLYSSLSLSSRFIRQGCALIVQRASYNNSNKHRSRENDYSSERNRGHGQRVNNSGNRGNNGRGYDNSNKKISKTSSSSFKQKSFGKEFSNQKSSRYSNDYDDDDFEVVVNDKSAMSNISAMERNARNRNLGFEDDSKIQSFKDYEMLEDEAEDDHQGYYGKAKRSSDYDDDAEDDYYGKVKQRPGSKGNQYGRVGKRDQDVKRGGSDFKPRGGKRVEDDYKPRGYKSESELRPRRKRVDDDDDDDGFSGSRDRKRDEEYVSRRNRDSEGFEKHQKGVEGNQIRRKREVKDSDESGVNRDHDRLPEKSKSYNEKGEISKSKPFRFDQTVTCLIKREGFDYTYGKDAVYWRLKLSHASDLKACFISSSKANATVLGDKKKDRLKSISDLCFEKNVPISYIDTKGLARFEAKQHQGVVLQSSKKEFPRVKWLKFDSLNRRMELSEPPKQKNWVKVKRAFLNHDGKTPVVIALDNVTDPQNIGALIRSSHFMDMDAMIVSDYELGLDGGMVRASACAALVSKRTFRTTGIVQLVENAKENGWFILGTHLHEDPSKVITIADVFSFIQKLNELDITQTKSIGDRSETVNDALDSVESESSADIELDSVKSEIVSTETDGEALIYPWQKRPLLFILGNEGSGMRESLTKLCDLNIIISKRNGDANSEVVDSLNVSVAGALIMNALKDLQMAQARVDGIDGKVCLSNAPAKREDSKEETGEETLSETIETIQKVDCELEDAQPSNIESASEPEMSNEAVEEK